MASGARSPPSEETPDGRRIALATRLRLPPPRRRFPAPSRGEPGGRAARTPRAAGPAATTPPPPPRPLRLSDSVGPLNERRLVAHLRLALGREARLWRGGHPQAKGLLPLSRRLLPLVDRDQPPATFPAIPPPPLEQVELSGALQEVVLQLRRLGNLFLFSHSTFNLALTTCCRLLASGTVRESLLHIVTVTCLRLAAKVNEEEELIPRTEDFIKYCGSDCTPSELLRMELAILDKLHWDLCIGTPLDFLNIFHALVVVGWPHVVELLPQRNPSLHVASLTKQLQHCMAGHQLLQFKGSTLALVIITLELERLMPDWCAPISDLLKKAQVGIEQFVHCRILVKRQLRSVESSSCTDNVLFHLPACTPSPVPFTGNLSSVGLL